MGGPTASSNRRAEKLDLWAVPDRELSSQITAHWDAIGPSAWPRPLRLCGRGYYRNGAGHPALSLSAQVILIRNGH